MYSRLELPPKTTPLPSPFLPNQVFPAKKPDSHFHNASGMHSKEQLFGSYSLDKTLPSELKS